MHPFHFGRMVARASVAALVLTILSLPLAGQPMTLRYLAGAPSMSGPDGAAADARFGFGYGNTIARDAAGNLYFSSSWDSTIRRLSPAGEVTTVAGQWATSGWADGTGAQARFSNPYGIAFDDAGNLYVADAGNQVIRKITAAREVTTIAGAPGVAQSVDGPIASARFNDPRGVIVDHNGVIYVAEYGTGKIRKIANGTVSTIANDFDVQGMAVDTNNNILMADQMKVSRMAPDGTLTFIAGNSVRGFADGTGAAARFDVIQGLTADPTGSVMYVTDQWNGRIRKITSAGVVTTIAGPGTGIPVDGTGAAARFTLSIAGIVLDQAHGELYVCDQHAIRKVTTSGVVTTVAGLIQYASIDGPARSARFYQANGIATDSLGNVYVAEKQSYKVRKVSPAGDVTTLAGNGSPGSADGTGTAATFGGPQNIAVDGSDNLYVTDGNGIRKITSSGVVTTFAGAVYTSGSADGAGTAARFNTPYGIVFSASCNCLYVSDNGNQTIRKILLDGTVTTFAGRVGIQGSSNGTGTSATFKGPSFLAVDGGGNLYLTENGHWVRKITAAGVVTTFAGQSSTSGEVDATGTSALFNSPNGLTCDDAGNVYVADYWGPTVRKITPAGVVSTILGRANVYGDTIEGTGTSARMLEPWCLASDHSGNLYLVEYDGHTIDKITPALPDTATASPISGAPGVARQLDVLPRTGTTWRWDFVRHPAGSSATLSATNIANPLFTPDVIDTFTFRVTTESGGMSAVTEVSVSAACDTTAPSIAITSGTNPSCAGAAVTLDAGAWSSYSWSTGATTRTITVTPSVTTTYSVTVVDSYGCTRSQASRTITVTPVMTAVTVSGSGATSACAGGTGGTFTAQASGGGVIAYQWGYRSVSGGAITDLTSATSASYTLAASDFPAAGNYLLVCRAAPQCGSPQVSNESSVTIQPLVDPPAVTTSGPTTFCAGDSVTLTAPAGFTYAWSGGATTSSIVVTQSGNYSVTVTNAAGCSATSAATAVTVNPKPATPVITASGPTTFCAGGSVDLTAPAGYNYSWSNGASARSITVTQTANLTVTVTDANGCSATSAPTQVTVNAVPDATVSVTGSTMLCAGASVHLAAPAGMASYLWSNGATTSAIDPTTAGNYSVTVTNASGCSSTSTPVAVTSDPTTLTIQADRTTVCAGTSLHLTSSVANGSALSYQWYTFGGAAIGGATSPDIDVTPSSNTYYFLRVADANGCTVQSNTWIVTSSHADATITADGPTTFCAGGSVTLSAPAGNSYAWSNGATTQSITVNASGAYSVTVTNSDGCSATSTPTSVTVNEIPDATVTVSGPVTICPGGSVTLTAQPGYSYAWSPNGEMSRSITVSQGGSYAVTVSANGCSAQSQAVAVSVSSPSATITPSGPTTFCAGGSVTLSAPAGNSYTWSTGATTQSITVNQSNTYTVTVHDANGCTASSSTMVTVNPLPTATVSGTTAICAGGSATITATLTGSAPWTVTWSDNVTQTINSGTTASRSVNPAATTTYTVTSLTDANCTGTSSGAATITVRPLPTAAVSGTSSICPGGSTTIIATLTGTAPWTVTWSDNVTQTINSGTTASRSVNPTATTTYTVASLTDANCAGTASGSATVTIRPLPSAVVSGTTAICAGGSATITAALTGTAPFTVTWSDNVTQTINSGTTASRNVSPSASTTYTVTSLTDANCTGASSGSATITIRPLPTATVSGTSAICPGGSTTITALLTGTAPWTVTWSDNVTQTINSGTTASRSVNPSASTTYTVTSLTDANCTGTASGAATVTIRPLPTAVVSGTAAICPGGSTTIIATLTGTAPWTVTWSDNVTQTINSGTTASRSVSPASDTTYTVTTLTDANCTGTSSGSAAVTIKTLPTATVSGGGAICPGASTTITAALTGTAPFTVIWSDNVTQTINSGTTASRTVSPAATTTYTVTSVTDAASCPRAGSGSATVTLNAAASITTQPSNVTTTRNTNITLTVVAAGTTPISYQWFNGNGTIISGATSSSYTTSFTKKGTNTFYVEVWNACNTTHVRSNTVTVTVN